jgi:hypothetical protein
MTKKRKTFSPRGAVDPTPVFPAMRRIADSGKQGAVQMPHEEGDTRGPQMTAAMVRLARMADVLFVRCQDESNDPDPDYGF